MSIWKRLTRIFRSRKNRDAGDIEALKGRLDESYRSQLALLQQVRRGVADVATSRKRVELQITQLTQQGAQLDGAARAAVANGDDDAARGALTRKVTLDKAVADLTAQHAGLRTEEDKLEDSAQQIQVQIEEFRLRKDTLSARHTAAAARSEINSATTGISSQMGEVGQAVKAAEQRTRELEAHADAVDELVREGVISGPGEDPHSTEAFDAQFESLSSTTDVDRQLDALKSGTSPGDEHGQDKV
ncbi:MAG: PspA/IM30 family protein [Actinomycetota bacterium]|nr:PspA/IM30 family protein [Actinomycetota bacterium]